MPDEKPQLGDHPLDTVFRHIEQHLYFRFDLSTEIVPRDNFVNYDLYINLRVGEQSAMRYLYRKNLTSEWAHKYSDSILGVFASLYSTHGVNKNRHDSYTQLPNWNKGSQVSTLESSILNAQKANLTISCCSCKRKIKAYFLPRGWEIFAGAGNIRHYLCDKCVGTAQGELKKQRIKAEFDRWANILYQETENIEENAICCYCNRQQIPDIQPVQWEVFLGPENTWHYLCHECGYTDQGRWKKYNIEAEFQHWVSTLGPETENGKEKLAIAMEYQSKRFGACL